MAADCEIKSNAGCTPQMEVELGRLAGGKEVPHRRPR